ncbi:hypothetical protein MLD38_009028 [Melastoma candidum]|uniref:Uncharacterized protein n=1 Tax=Melastoma candidum TaxID=119954 RepID=A0ACB9RXM3_9MYRT|nr:hypothetical protein MLD38_009028 [Melastoma candidum]
MDDDPFCGIFVDEELVDTNFARPMSPDDMFRMFDGGFCEDLPLFPSLELDIPLGDGIKVKEKGGEDSEVRRPGVALPEASNDGKSRLKRKRTISGGSGVETEEDGEEGNQRMSHIAVERNRRKQMNEQLSILRSIMPCFYIKRGDQASIIGGVVEYISELRQVLKSLEDKKQRKAYSEVLSPRPIPAEAPLISPRKPPLSPRMSLSLPISPKTPQPSSSPYKPTHVPPQLLPISLSPTSSSSSTSAPTPSSFDSHNNLQPLAVNSKSGVADVEVRFSGTDLVLRTISPRIPGQALKIITALEDLPLEILHARIFPVDESTIVNSFTIKIGIECQLSAEELAQQIQQTFPPLSLKFPKPYKTK